MAETKYKKGHQYQGCVYSSGTVLDQKQSKKDPSDPAKKKVLHKYRLVLQFKRGEKWANTTRMVWVSGIKEAYSMLDQWQAEKEAELSPKAVAKTKTFAETCDDYIAFKRDVEHRQASTLAYHSYMAAHVPDYISTKPIDQVTADDGIKWSAEISDEDGAAGAYDRKSFKFAKAVLSWACDTDKIAKDPWRVLKVPTSKTGEANALPPDEAARLAGYLKVMPATNINVAIALALYAGLRESEACALRFGDIDFDAERLHVWQAIGRAGTTTYVKGPKSKASDRFIPISEPLMTELLGIKAHVLAQLTEAKTSEEVLSDCYVIGKLDKYLDPHDVGRMWRGVASSLQLKGTTGKAPTFHGLRKSFSSLGYKATKDTKAQDVLLGHGSETLALNVYTVTYEDDARAFVDGVVDQMNKATISA